MFQALKTCDILPADVVAIRKGNAKLDRLADRYHLQPGGKRRLNEEQFNEFAIQFLDAVRGYDVMVEPGGSSANTMTTLNKLLNNRIDITFIGVEGRGAYNDVISDWLRQADLYGTLKKNNIHLVPQIPASSLPQSAVSFVILNPDGERSIVTYPGNAKELLTVDMLSGVLGENDPHSLFLQGSSRQKFSEAFVNKQLKWRWDDEPRHRRKLILALPTHALTKDEKEYFQWLATSADIVLGNREEMEGLGTNLSEFQSLLRRSSINNPLAFITDGKKGAIAMRADGRPVEVAAPVVANKVNTLGCGDSFSAGVLAAAALDLQHPTLPPEVLWAKVGNEVAGATLQVMGAQAPDPLGVLRKSNLWPVIADQWQTDGRQTTYQFDRKEGQHTPSLFYSPFEPKWRGRDLHPDALTS